MELNRVEAAFPSAYDRLVGDPLGRWVFVRRGNAAGECYGEEGCGRGDEAASVRLGLH